MAITITTPSQLDTFIISCQDFIQKKVVTNIPDYNVIVKPNMTLLSYRLADKAFRGQPVEGVLMLFKKRAGMVLPQISDFYIVDEDITFNQAFQGWCNLQLDLLDKDTFRFVLKHLVYYFNFNDNLFYQITNTSQILTNIPIE